MTALHHHPFHRDADGIDRFKDEWVTGEDIYDPEYLPPLRHGRPFLPLADLVTGELRTASPWAESHSRVHASSPAQTGRDGRGSAPSTSTSVGASPSRAGEHPGALGGGPDSSPTGTPRAADSPPGRARVPSHLEDEASPGRHPGSQ